METLLALGAAISYGASDFAGGVLGRTTRVLVIVLLSQLLSFALLLGAVPLWEAAPLGSAIAWGAAAGLAGVTGTSLLYRGLSIGQMSVVAPITGVVGAGIPVLFGLALGERPGPAATVGVVLGLFAVVAITRAPQRSQPEVQARIVDDPVTRLASKRGIREAFGAGVGFGLFFVLLGHSPVDSGLWPLVGMRISMIVALGCVVAIGRIPVRVPVGLAVRLIGLGFINALADLLYLLATREGLLSLVAVITSLYPAATVILARVILNERLAGQQLIGLAMAAGSVALIALS